MLTSHFGFRFCKGLKVLGRWHLRENRFQGLINLQLFFFVVVLVVFVLHFAFIFWKVLKVFWKGVNCVRVGSTGLSTIYQLFMILLHFTLKF